MNTTATSIFAEPTPETAVVASSDSAEAIKSLRILAVSALWQGANDYAFVRAFRRAGHSVQVVSERDFIPSWRSAALRLLRKGLKERLAGNYNQALVETARVFSPDLFFVFKGANVYAATIGAIKAGGAIAIQFYPDVSFRTHGPFLPKALPQFDWVLTTKSFGLADMATQLGVHSASFLPHAYDPETHRPLPCTQKDAAQYACDASFIGNWSAKKQGFLSALTNALPSLDMKIWGPAAWRSAGQSAACFQDYPVFGDEYAKAVQLSCINIALLSEARTGSSSGDLITARTFEIPAAGGFMMHERTEEAMQYFKDGKECAFFDGPDDLVEKVRYYLAHDEERRAIAEAGHRRCMTSGYSVDDRARAVVEKYHELRRARG
ncbi:MAG: glycosyltransferase [Pseudomonadota bacterium]